MEQQRYCKRLIEVDLPIKKISEHARREKSIRHGHISTLHIWWARRPLAACRAVLCAALWPDPADSLCPEKFKKESARLMKEFRDKRGGKPKNWSNPIELREALLDFIADFANWDNSTNSDFLAISRKLTSTAHQSLGTDIDDRPLVVDSFAGGGAIPLEALRVGADAFASDLNPVAVLLNKVVLEFIPKYGIQLADDVIKWGHQIKKMAETELAQFYSRDSDGAIPIAYLWARIVQCEGPSCGVEIPLLRSLLIAKKGKKKIVLELVPDKENKSIGFNILENLDSKSVVPGTVAAGAVTCPCCGYTTKVKSVRAQLKKQNGGAKNSRLYCVVTRKYGMQNNKYRMPNKNDFAIIGKANKKLSELLNSNNKQDIIPNESLPPYGALGFRVQNYGITKWSDLFTNRQLLSMCVYTKIIADLINSNSVPESVTIMAFTIGKIAQVMSSITRWRSDVERCEGAFGMQTLQMVWDYAEINPVYSDYPENHSVLISKIIRHINSFSKHVGSVEKANATNHPLPDDSCSVFFTDPPYYDAISYADLSDYFYIWIKRALRENMSIYFEGKLTPKKAQAIMNPKEKDESGETKDSKNYEKKMRLAFEHGRRIVKPNGIGCFVFAHKSTAGWEAMIEALLKSGWIITASWPIDTEMGSRMRAMNSAALSSSVHLICRPREHLDGSLRIDDIGDWRDVLQELPKRIHEWMPRLAEEGIVGADAIFACLGPALEIFSQYSHVEKANGNKVGLREYLEQVWAAVAKEALNMIFEGAHTEGFEEDSRLTAMWLWTLSTSANGNGKEKDVSNSDEDENGSSKAVVSSGFSLEFDAARKIAQGLGAHLEKLSNLIEVKGGKARLLPVSERVKSLFGKDSSAASTYKRKKKEKQLTLFDELKTVQEEDWSLGDTKAEVGKTVLNRLHQSMILFGAGRNEALRRFLVEEGVGKDERFWRLAQALSALYPPSTDEKRWVDGVLAKKKSFGF